MQESSQLVLIFDTEWQFYFELLTSSLRDAAYALQMTHFHHFYLWCHFLGLYPKLMGGDQNTNYGTGHFSCTAHHFQRHKGNLTSCMMPCYFSDTFAPAILTSRCKMWKKSQIRNQRRNRQLFSITQSNKQQTLSLWRQWRILGGRLLTIYPDRKLWMCDLSPPVLGSSHFLSE